MSPTDPTALAVYDGARAVTRRGIVAKIAKLEADYVALEHRAPSVVAYAVTTYGPADGARTAEQIVAALDDMADEIARLRHRLTDNYADVPEQVRDLECRVGSWRRDVAVTV